MGLGLNLSGSNSSGGSVNSAQGASQAWSNTAGVAASIASARQAELAHERQKELLAITQEYNAREAQKTRDWEERMANSIYTRSVANMKEAGINPILAANFGLSGASIGSGATASLGTPSTFMGQTYAEQNSASSAYNNASGSSWNNSESGLATFLEQMGTLAKGIAGYIQNGMNIDISLEGMNDFLHNGGAKKGGEKVNSTKNKIGKSVSSMGNSLLNIFKTVK